MHIASAHKAAFVTIHSLACLMQGPRVSVAPLAQPRQPSITFFSRLKSSRTFGVFLGPVSYAVAQLGIALLHVVCVVYFAVAGFLYYVLPASVVARSLAFYSLAIDSTHFRWIAVIHFVLAVVHIVCLGSLLISSGLMKRCSSSHFRNRSLSVQRRVTVALKSSVASIQAFADDRLTSTVSLAVTTVSRTRLGRALVHTYAVVLAPKGFFGVESDHFELIFVIREVTETILQTYQAYHMNRLLPRPQLNRVYVALLVLNCWLTPLLHCFVGHNAALARLLYLLSDILLDFTSAIGVPVRLVVDYIGRYNPVDGDFEYLDYYDDAWLVRFMNDAPLILIRSSLEAFSRVIFSLSMIVSINDVLIVIKPKRSPSRIDTISVPVDTKNPARTTSPPTSNHQPNTLVRWMHRCLVLVGAAILGIHLHAESKTSPSSCVIPVHPWLVRHPACALVEINCFTNAMPKLDQSVLEFVFSTLDKPAISFVVVRHCAHIELTMRMQTFENLIGLKLYNSTVVTWTKAATITPSYHPQLRSLYFVRTDFSNATLPDGLLFSQLPAVFANLEISSTNLNHLPDDLHERWTRRIALSIEYAPITEFPPCLTKMDLHWLSLSQNKLQSLPPATLTIPSLRQLALMGNPITSLPELASGSAVTATFLELDMTLITGPLPMWIDEAIVEQTVIHLGGSPFCTNVVLNQSSAERAALMASRPWLVDGRISCELFTDPYEYSFYPLGVDVWEDEAIAGAAP